MQFYSWCSIKSNKWFTYIMNIHVYSFFSGYNYLILCYYISTSTVTIQQQWNLCSKTTPWAHKKGSYMTGGLLLEVQIYGNVGLCSYMTHGLSLQWSLNTGFTIQSNYDKHAIDPQSHLMYHVQELQKYWCKPTGLVGCSLVAAVGETVTKRRPLLLHQGAEPIYGTIVRVQQYLCHWQYLCGEIPAVLQTDHHRRSLYI